ncbi:MAG TPA: hypothetical protein VFL91_18315 [Thermomicrobiales bacterium]|nr:hypothetical protein [Thermomicrobiales bacterium]
MSASDERLQVLQMLAEQRLTRDEAERLLDALDVAAPAAAPARREDPAPASFAGLPCSVGDLIALRGMGVTRGYVDELRAAGLTGFDLGEAVALKGVGVDADYIAALVRAGLTNLDAGQLIALKGCGVDADYVGRVRDAGLGDLDPDELIALRGAGIDPACLRDAAR